MCRLEWIFLYLKKTSLVRAAWKMRLYYTPASATGHSMHANAMRADRERSAAFPGSSGVVITETVWSREYSYIRAESLPNCPQAGGLSFARLTPPHAPHKRINRQLQLLQQQERQQASERRCRVQRVHARGSNRGGSVARCASACAIVTIYTN